MGKDINFFENSLKELKEFLVELGKFKYGNLDDLEASIMCEIPTIKDSNTYIKVFYRGITIRLKIVNNKLELVLGRNIEVAWHGRATEIVESTIYKLEKSRLPIHYIKSNVVGGITDVNITESGFVEGEYNITLSKGVVIF